MSRPCLRRSTPRRIAASAAASSPPPASATDGTPTTPHAAACTTTTASASDNGCGRARPIGLDLAVDVHDRPGRRVGDQVPLDRLAADRQLRRPTLAAV